MKTSYISITVLVIFLTTTIVGAQHKKNAILFNLNDGLRYELIMMRDELTGLEKTKDVIASRHGQESESYRKAEGQLDELIAESSARVKEIVTTHSWPRISEVGEDGSTALWLIIQYGDKELLKYCAPLMTKAAKAGEADRFQAAVLQDKALIMNGKKQWYGTQLFTNTEGKLEIFPVADEVNIDKRRQEMQLGPMTEYLSHLKVEYVPKVVRPVVTAD